MRGGVFENPIEVVLRPHGLASCLLIGFGKFAAHFSWLRHRPLFYDVFRAVYHGLIRVLVQG